MGGFVTEARRAGRSKALISLAAIIPDWTLASPSKQVLALGTGNRLCRLGRGPPSSAGNGGTGGSHLPRPHDVSIQVLNSVHAHKLASFTFLLAECQGLTAKLYAFHF